MTTYKVHFPPRGLHDSDGQERPRGGINYLNAKTQRWPVYDLQGEFAIHERIEYPLSSKPRKDLRWRHADGRLSRNGEISGRDRVYGLERVDGQRQGLLVEGEKCVDAAGRVLPSTWLVAGTVCGAASIPEEDVLDRLALIPRWFLWPDADANGRGQEHMDRIAAYMKGRCEVRTVIWHTAPPGGDVADYLRNHSRAELIALLRDAEPVK